MAAPISTLDRFIRTLHRRLVVVRAAEAAGLGTLAGCAIALLVIPVLIWRHQPPLLPAVVVVGLGAFGGLLWNLSRRPTRLQAAMEADRQLELADLLGTAVGVRERGRGDDPWEQTVVALADATSRQHTPSQVLLNRLGARAWGGIGLAAALVFTLAALPSFPTGADASSDSRRAGRPNRTASLDAPQRAVGFANRPPSKSAVSGSPSRIGTETRSMTAADSDDAGENEANRTGTDTAPRGDAGGDRDGVGGGTAKARQPGRPNPLATPPQGTPNRPSVSPDGPTAGGGNVTGSESGKTNPTDSSTTANPSSGTANQNPWKSDSWPQDVRRANEVIDSGAIPDAYRDLVRDYFDRS
jgi:hypothetical protein